MTLFTNARFEGARAVVEKAVAALEPPGAVAFVGTREDAECVAAAGVTRLQGGVPVTPGTVYDLASLTKVVATLPAVLKLVGEGEIGLDDRVRRFFSNAGWFQDPSLGDATVKELLTHTSGLPAWKPLFALSGERRTVLANVLQTSLEHPGAYTYSDLGFILLGAVVERVSGERQDAFVQRYVFGPLGMTETRYGPVRSEHVAATEDCGWRGELLQGVVHDENAFVMGGVAGHAGLFGTAKDLATYAQAWLRLDPRLGPEDLLRDAVREHFSGGSERRGLGWMLKGEGSSAGRHASAYAYGHTGFTGTSLWVDPVGGWFAVLLTNRAHPSRENGRNIHPLRVAFHEAVARGFGA